MITHILPIDDLKEHSEEIVNHLGLLVPMCECQPKVKQEYMSEEILIIHSSFDGREALEEFYEIINNKNT